MANTRELRRRIKSVKNTSQITKAMQMVAATKMRRAQTQALNGRPYSLNLSEALQRLLPRVDVQAHPLLLGNDSDKKGIILLSTDKGLVGALNTNLIRIASNLQSGIGSSVFYTVGRKGRSFVAKSGKELVADFENVDNVTFREAVQLSKLVSESFLASEVGGAYVLYPHFISTLKQEPKMLKILPIQIEDLQEYMQAQAHLNTHPRGDVKQSASAHPGGGARDAEFLFEPNIKQLLDYALVHYLQIKIYQALLETKASEHSARMIAMQNATDNAKELVEDLTLTYNQTRQSAITTELLEITTAQIAME